MREEAAIVIRRFTESIIQLTGGVMELERGQFGFARADRTLVCRDTNGGYHFIETGEAMLDMVLIKEPVQTAGYLPMTDKTGTLRMVLDSDTYYFKTDAGWERIGFNADVSGKADKADLGYQIKRYYGAWTAGGDNKIGDLIFYNGIAYLGIGDMGGNTSAPNSNSSRWMPLAPASELMPAFAPPQSNIPSLAASAAAVAVQFIWDIFKRLLGTIGAGYQQGATGSLITRNRYYYYQAYVVEYNANYVKYYVSNDWSESDKGRMFALATNGSANVNIYRNGTNTDSLSFFSNQDVSCKAVMLIMVDRVENGYPYFRKVS